MTNAEKAIEIANNAKRQIYFDARCNDLVGNIAFQSASIMAEWRDSQLQKELDKAVDLANTYYDNKLNQNMLYRNLGKIELLSKLLNIDFPYSSLHMNFVTMD